MRPYTEYVTIDTDKLEEELKERGIKHYQLCEVLGKGHTYITDIKRRGGRVARSAAVEIEKALFKPQGYFTFVETTSQFKTAGETQDKSDVLLKHLDTHFYKIEKILSEYEGDGELMKKLFDIETAIKQTNTWLARLYAVWTKEDEK